MKDKSEYEKTKAQFYDNYKTSGMVSIAPLLLSYMLIKTEPSKGGFDFSSGFKLVGVLTLPATIALTVVTLPLGILGALGNSGWGVFALPIAAFHDKNQVINNDPSVNTIEPIAERRNSIKVMHDLMPFGSKPDRELELEDTASPKNQSIKTNTVTEDLDKSQKIASSVAAMSL